jgi:antitoxin (DNA-binding transcriptional repressor) of toxin-antitoxin stability system
MKTATVRDLRNQFPLVARWIEEGESVEITRSGKPFARLAPITETPVREVVMPDFLARMRQDFPNEKVSDSMQSIIDYDRSDR